ncbi:DUF2098 domain-containing protein [Methanobacterium sp.]|uniref:DUF2098 domain-containing protein n=1 Tax=Methanobacterium sp. TaxID=2164 RepID=UPI003C7389A1
MEISDSCGKPIIKGSYVIYNGTGTIGKVVDIKTQDDGIWAKLEDSDLWYKSNYLQAIEKIEKSGLKKETREDLKEKLKNRKKLVDGDIDMSTELCDGGG